MPETAPSPSPSAAFAGPPAGVDLWLTFTGDVSSDEREAFRTLLDADEHTRLARMKAPSTAEGFLIGRALLRTTLSRYAAVAPQAWRFALERHGRPAIDPASGGPADLHFNLSHTNGLVALAVAGVEALGVDVETIDRQNHLDALLERSFTAGEAATVRAAPDEAAFRERFFAIWTLKEAHIKARGTGLAMPLASFGFDTIGEYPGVAFRDPTLGEASAWAFRRAAVSPVHRLALGVSPADRLDGLRTYRTVPGREAAEPVTLNLEGAP